MAVCSVVDPIDPTSWCLAPANLEEADQPHRIGTCYRCGEPVCSNCSAISMDRYAGRRTRRCLRCREAENDLALATPERSAS